MTASRVTAAFMLASKLAVDHSLGELEPIAASEVRIEDINDLMDADHREIRDANGLVGEVIRDDRAVRDAGDYEPRRLSARDDARGCRDVRPPDRASRIGARFDMALRMASRRLPEVLRGSINQWRVLSSRFSNTDIHG